VTNTVRNPAQGALRVGPVVASLLLAGTALALDLALAKPGASANFVRFVGRFHPLVVHLPIGFLLLIAFAETLTLFPRWKSRIDPALALLWPVLAVSAVVAFGLGLLLAHDGGYPAKLVSMHRRLTLAAVLAIALNLALWARVEQGRLPRIVYRGVLLAALGLLSVGAHFGGSLSRGENYLFEFAPAFVQRLLHMQAPKPEATPPTKAQPNAEPLVYRDVVAPIFRERCVSCHGPDKTKGNLRLDSFENLKKGGKNGPELLAGDSAHSRLIERMALPLADDEHMPPEDKTQPAADEVDVVKWWTDRGATETLRVRDALVPDGARALLIHSAVASGVSGLGSASPTPIAPTAAKPTSTESTPSPAPVGAAEHAPTAAVASPANTDQKSLFGSVLTPLLQARCGKCHGTDKQKGRLRLDSRAALIQGGKNGPGVVARDAARGTVLARLSLPPSDDQHMPPTDEPQLTSSQIALLKWWVTAGASNEISSAEAPAALLASARVSRAAPRAPSPHPAAAESAAQAAAPQTPADPTLLAALPPTIRLYRDIVQPMLANRCGSCHGGADPDGDMRVDDHAQLLASKAIVPGKPSQSQLLVRARLPLSNDDHMPPPVSSQPAAAELEALELWIAGGASENAEVEARSLPEDVAELVRNTLASAAPPPVSVAAAPNPPPQAAAQAIPRANALASLTPPHAGCASCAIGAHEARPPLAFALPWLIGLGLYLRRQTRARSANSLEKPAQLRAAI
jgi:mono/diheme cytochrome c family protein